MKFETMSRPVPATMEAPRRLHALRGPLAAAWLAAFAGLTACGSSETAPTETEGGPAAAEASGTSPGGAKLVALKDRVVVWSEAAVTASPIGWLQLGALVGRSAEPVSRDGCEGGWYSIQPRGFVCAGEDASTDLNRAEAKLLSAGPNLARPLPYRYARVRRGEAVVYRKVPTPEEQLAAEPKLAKRKPLASKRLGAGPNDVPLDEAGFPLGPPVLQPDAEGVGTDGYRTTEAFFAFPGSEQASALLKPGEAIRRVGDDTQLFLQGSGVPIVTTFHAGEADDARQFALMPDGRFVPVDRLIPNVGTPWHGVRSSEGGLPVAFTIRAGVVPWTLGKGDQAEPVDEEYEPHQAVDLTGRFRTVNSVLHYCARTDGPERWVRARDIILIPKRTKFPDFASEGQKWLDVSLANQTLVAYEGHRPVLATLISSGRDRLGDPAEGPATPQGVFEIRAKDVTASIDPREVGESLTVNEVPWVAHINEELAITGSYWLKGYGEAQSYHNVALSPLDARWFWTWADPPVPAGWHGVIADGSAPSTIVYIHR